MAIAFDAATDGGALAASPKTFSHTCTGTDLFLIVFTFQASTTDNVTGVTYNGVALTKAGFSPSDAGINYYGIGCWYLLNPATGANTVEITTSSGTVTGVAHSYTGVVGGFDNVATNSVASGTSLTVSVTTVADNCWTAMGASNGDGELSAGSGIERVDLASIGSTSTFDSNAAVTPPGSTSLQATWATSASAGGIIISFSPTAAASATTSRRRMMTGIGS